MNEKAKAFYGGKVDLKRDAITLTNNGNKCPVCGKEFQPTPPLIPNVKMKEFYGGRIKFFKEVRCDCTAEYRLCIEQRFDPKEAQNVLKVLDMIVLKPGLTEEELQEKKTEEINAQVEDKIHQAFEEGRFPSLKEREKMKKETVLANIVDLDTKIETLCYHTLLELQVMCKQEKVKFAKRDSKKDIARKLLAKNPNLVTAEKSE